MKKKKSKSPVNAEKAARNRISTMLYREMKAVTDKLIPDSKKMDKALKKDAKQLAKKISKQLSIDELALKEGVEVTVDRATKAIQPPKALTAATAEIPQVKATGKSVISKSKQTTTKKPDNTTPA